MSEKNIRLLLQYDGTRYRGWQKQQNTTQTVQGKLEGALQQIFGSQVEIHGSGRTDAGVHALGQVANFHVDTEKQPEEILAEFNRLLPSDIQVLEAQEAAPRFHSRLHAVGKHYRYCLCVGTRSDVFARKYEWLLEPPLPEEQLHRVAAMLTGTHDFKCLCDEHKKGKTTVRTIKKIDINSQSLSNGTRYVLDFYGDGFLYHMVRHIVALMVCVGKGQISLEQAEAYINGTENRFGPLAPAQGLFLVEVYY